VADTLAGLQAAFPATVHNVVRTARKLELRGGAAPELCALCGGVREGAGAGAGGACWLCAPCGRLRGRGALEGVEWARE
jgi:hypothetical protein